VGRRQFWATVVVALVGFASVLSLGGQLASNHARPSAYMTHLCEQYGVSEDKVRKVAAAYGVAPKDMASYGPSDFPVNYIARKLNEIREQRGRITTDDVSRIVRGYECVFDEGRAYAFYTANAKHGLFDVAIGRQALVVHFSWKSLSPASDDPQEIEGWHVINMYDNPGFYLGADMDEECVSKRVE
jgi:hypothetical protein